ALLDGAVAAAKRVIVRIADDGRIFAMVSAVMLGNLSRQAVEFLFRLGGGKFFDGLVHADLARLRALAGRAASATSRLAAARASAVMLAPDNMRAISSIRASSSRSAMRVLSPTREMRKCRA